MLRSLVRNAVDRMAPAAGRYYRDLRDARALEAELRQFTATPFGFDLSGAPYIDESWQTDETKLFLRHLEKCSCAVDIGAHVGYYTCLAAARGAHVISFEPNPTNVKFLFNNLTHNGLLDDVEVYPVGLSDAPGLKRMYLEGNLSSFVQGWGESDNDCYAVVPVSTLDIITVPRLLGRQIIIKLDVEGFENEVLRGATQILEFSPKPIWMVEILLNDPAVPGGFNHRFCETFEVFWKRGYKCTRAVDGEPPVGPDEVKQWVRDGSIGSGPRVPNFFFSET